MQGFRTMARFASSETAEPSRSGTTAFCCVTFTRGSGKLAEYRFDAKALAERGFSASQKLVGRLLRRLGFSLQANSKTREGTHHPDRNAHFETINAQVQAFQAAGQPAISVDIRGRNGCRTDAAAAKHSSSRRSTSVFDTLLRYFQSARERQVQSKVSQFCDPN